MSIFGDQYYLDLYTRARCELSQQNKVSNPNSLFDKMWELHNLKASILSLDQNSQTTEKKKILTVIKCREEKMAEIHEQIMEMVTGKPPRRPAWVNKLISLRRQVENTSHSGRLTPEFGKLAEAIRLLVKRYKSDKRWLVEIDRADSVLNQIKLKGYSWNPKAKCFRPPSGGYVENNGGLPRNFITSGWETNRRKH